MNENISLIIQDEEFLVSNTYVSQEFTQKYVSNSIKVENLGYNMTGLVFKNLEKFGSKYLPNTFKIKLGNLEAKETDNIWQSNHAPYKLDVRSPFVKNIELGH